MLTNTLVPKLWLYMGPAEYRTRDYIKVGGFVSLIYIMILVAMVYFFYL
jgi:di/tricarboxylate transporter